MPESVTINGIKLKTILQSLTLHQRMIPVMSGHLHFSCHGCRIIILDPFSLIRIKKQAQQLEVSFIYTNKIL